MQINNTIQTRLQTLINNIASDFSLDKLSKSPARFNLEKLNWFNREYIKMMSLEEFAYRAFDVKLKRKFPDTVLRKGVYIYLIDTKLNKILTCDIPTEFGQDGMYYMLGGGIDEGESELECVIREVDEESKGVIKLDPKNLKFITSFDIVAKDYIRDNINYNGKTMSFWFCEFDSTQFKELHSIDSDVDFVYEWIDLEQVLATNGYLTYPIWKEFCENSDLGLLEPTDRIKAQYLAWSLDKNRITTLSELGMESDCILEWEQPEPELIKWKKITLEESLNNLVELKPVLKNIYEKLSSSRLELFESDINNLPENLQKNTELWEAELKQWLSSNSKDAGSYFWPLRTALSGKVKSPSPFEILAILDWNEIETRIDNIISSTNS